MSSSRVASARRRLVGRPAPLLDRRHPGVVSALVYCRAPAYAPHRGRQVAPARGASRGMELGHLVLVLEGLHVPKRVASQRSERARLQVLVRTRNLELRRLLLDRIGYERFLDAAGSDLVAQDDFGKLWRCTLQIDDEPLHVVEVVNSTPEPDGTHRRYLLRVPPESRTARQAVAWTFGFNDPQQYLLAAQS